MLLQIFVEYYVKHSLPLNIGQSGKLPSSSSTVNPINPSSLNTQNYTVPFVAMNKSVEPFDLFDHQFTPENILHEIDANMIFTIGEQIFDPVAYNQ